MRVRTVLQRYFDEHVTYKTTDYPRIYKIAQKHLTSYFGNTHTTEIGAAECRAYAKWREKGGGVVKRTLKDRTVSGSTVRRELGCLSAACGWGIDAGWLTKDDRPHFVLPPPSEVKDVWLSKDEALRLLDEAAKISWRLHLFVCVGLFTGARPSAVRYLQWGQIDLKAELIDFRGMQGVNSRKRYGVVRMMAELVPLLKAAHARRKERGDFWLLGTTKGLDEQFARAREAAGVDKRVTPNTLRHTWATWSAQDGVDLYMIARVLGSSLKVVEKRYAHWHPSYQKEATQKVFFEGRNVGAPA